MAIKPKYKGYAPLDKIEKILKDLVLMRQLRTNYIFEKSKIKLIAKEKDRKTKKGKYS